MVVSGSIAAQATACLAQAIYYEAGGEGLQGGRAVAQVVLNRVRHPSYPSSICGVVYEGSERSTGCQFTFTCDGSLRRPPLAGLWAQSLRIAKEALAGYVYKPVGHATHFHANYVLPYWADSLEKKVQIARHIFYRLPGSLGGYSTFSQRYSGAEFNPSTAIEATDVTLSETVFDGEENPAPESNGLIATNQKKLVADLDLVPLADTVGGALISGGEPTASIPVKQRAAPKACPPGGKSKQLQRFGSNDIRIDRQTSPADCT